MSHVPNWWTLILLGLGIARMTRLVGWDDLTVPVRRWVCGMGDNEHHTWAKWIEELQQQGHDAWDPRNEASGLVPPVSPQRFYLSKLIHCPWCAGWWISIVWWLLWLAFPHAMLIAATPFAYSEVVGLVSKNLDP